jgi:hypothetical protein
MSLIAVQYGSCHARLTEVQRRLLPLRVIGYTFGVYRLAVKRNGPNDGREFVCVCVEGQLATAQWRTSLAGNSWQMD